MRGAWLLALALALGGASGCRMTYRVILRSPVPMAPLTAVPVVMVRHDWSQVRLEGVPPGSPEPESELKDRSEAEYVLHMTTAQRAEYSGLKAALDAAIVSSLRERIGDATTFTLTDAPPVPGEVRLIIQHMRIRPGRDDVFRKGTTVKTRFVWTQNGATRDIVEVSSRVPGSWAPTEVERITQAGHNLGNKMAAYYIRMPAREGNAGVGVAPAQ